MARFAELEGSPRRCLGRGHSCDGLRLSFGLVKGMVAGLPLRAGPVMRERMETSWAVGWCRGRAQLTHMHGLPTWAAHRGEGSHAERWLVGCERVRGPSCAHLRPVRRNRSRHGGELGILGNLLGIYRAIQGPSWRTVWTRRCLLTSQDVTGSHSLDWSYQIPNRVCSGDNQVSGVRIVWLERPAAMSTGRSSGWPLTPAPPSRRSCERGGWLWQHCQGRRLDVGRVGKEEPAMRARRAIGSGAPLIPTFCPTTGWTGEYGRRLTGGRIPTGWTEKTWSDDTS